VRSSKHFEGSHCLHLQAQTVQKNDVGLSDSEDEGTMTEKSAWTYSPINTVSHLRRPESKTLYGLRIRLTWQQMKDTPVFWDKTVEYGKQAPTFQ